VNVARQIAADTRDSSCFSSRNDFCDSPSSTSDSGLVPLYLPYDYHQVLSIRGRSSELSDSQEAFPSNENTLAQIDSFSNETKPKEQLEDHDQDEVDAREVEEMCIPVDLDDSYAEAASARSSLSSTLTLGDLTSSTTNNNNLEDTYADLKKQAKKLGFKNVRFIDKEVHDQGRKWADIAITRNLPISTQTLIREAGFPRKYTTFDVADIQARAAAAYPDPTPKLHVFKPGVTFLGKTFGASRLEPRREKGSVETVETAEKS